MIDLADVRAARERIGPHVRRTPTIRAAPARQALPAPNELWLKLENLQVTGSFKARGAVNKVLDLAPTDLARGIVTASGGNHGLGVAYAGSIVSAPTRIYLPRNAPAIKADNLRSWGAEVVVEGDVWDDANRAALAAAERDRMSYVHPFADPAVIAGQGTLAL